MINQLDNNNNNFSLLNPNMPHSCTSRCSINNLILDADKQNSQLSHYRYNSQFPTSRLFFESSIPQHQIQSNDEYCNSIQLLARENFQLLYKSQTKLEELKKNLHNLQAQYDQQHLQHLHLEWIQTEIQLRKLKSCQV